MRTLFLQALLLFAILVHPLQAQSDKELLASLVEANQKAVEALVMYPAETRVDILEVASYPDALIKLESMQAQTSAAFRQAIEPYPRETQAGFYDLTRYPGLLRHIVRESDGTANSLERVLKGYPADIREKAISIGEKHFDVLKKIDALNTSAESAAQVTIGGYPPKIQAALQRLLDLPEVLSLLTENLRLTILSGDLYRQNPAWTLHQADSLHLVVARRNAQEVEDWKKSLDEDPAARTELAAAADAYAEENGEKAEEYHDDLYYTQPNEAPAKPEEPHYYQYPYWFGYPYWYEYPYWRPYPWWWEWGFYYGPGRTIIIVGLPSYHFTHWYFYTPWHHEHWCHLSNHFVDHYSHHRESGGSISTGVVVWRREHGTVISDGWLNDDGRRTERFREFGRMETAREKYNRENPRQPLDEKEYLDRHTGRYPEMSRVEPPRSREPRVDQPRTEPPARLPREKAPTEKPRQPRTNEPVERPQNPPPRPPRTTPPEVQKGREQHESTTEREKARQNVQPPRSTPAPKVTPPRTETPKREKSGRRNQ